MRVPVREGVFAVYVRVNNKKNNNNNEKKKEKMKQRW